MALKITQYPGRPSCAGRSRASRPSSSTAATDATPAHTQNPVGVTSRRSAASPTESTSTTAMIVTTHHGESGTQPANRGIDSSLARTARHPRTVTSAPSARTNQHHANTSSAPRPSRPIADHISRHWIPICSSRVGTTRTTTSESSRRPLSPVRSAITDLPRSECQCRSPDSGRSTGSRPALDDAPPWTAPAGDPGDRSAAGAPTDQTVRSDGPADEPGDEVLVGPAEHRDGEQRRHCDAHEPGGAGER